jgi:YgiT-type zinc finger domain-containing protein
MDEVDDVKIRHKDIELPDAPGLRCPQCNIELLTEELVVEELANAEEMLQAK